MATTQMCDNELLDAVVNALDRLGDSDADGERVLRLDAYLEPICSDWAAAAEKWYHAADSNRLRECLSRLTNEQVAEVLALVRYPDPEDFTCDFCDEGGAAEECVESADQTTFLHERCVKGFEAATGKVLERRDECSEE